MPWRNLRLLSCHKPTVTFDRCLLGFAGQCRRQHTASESGLPPPRLDYRNISLKIREKVENALNRRAPVSPETLKSIPVLYEELKEVNAALSHSRHLRAQSGQRIQEAVKSNDSEEKARALLQASSLKKEISSLEEQLASVQHRLETAALAVPNDTHPLSPIGAEDSARVIAQKGPSLLPVDPHRDHVSICKSLDLLDLDAAAIVSGTSWYYLKNEAALLEMALCQYAMSIAIKHGFAPVLTPDAIRFDIAPRCGFQPREGPDSAMSQIYHVHSHLGSTSPGLILSATSEIPLAGMFCNKLVSPTSLPAKMVGSGHAFRAEAGARGADTRGLYRVHQFTKVELFVVSSPEDSDQQMENMLTVQEEILSGLNIPYRILEMPTQELGASAYRKIDIEAWMPGRGGWGEVSSLSNCTDYQARRMHIRLDKDVPRSDTPGASTRLSFAHTLNGTAAAIPRLIVALLENGAKLTPEGVVTGITLPKALSPFWLQGPPTGVVLHWE